MNISFEGGSVELGCQECPSIDTMFLPEDVANLAMMAYTDAIMDGSFFKDESLVCQYFQWTPNVKEVFEKLFEI